MRSTSCIHGMSVRCSGSRCGAAAVPMMSRDLFLLVAYDEMSVADAARALGLTTVAGRMRLARARKKLRAAAGLQDVHATDEWPVLGTCHRAAAAPAATDRSRVRAGGCRARGGSRDQSGWGRSLAPPRASAAAVLNASAVALDKSGSSLSPRAVSTSSPEASGSGTHSPAHAHSAAQRLRDWVASDGQDARAQSAVK